MRTFDHNQPDMKFPLAAFCLLFALSTLSAQERLDKWLTSHTPEMGGRSILLVADNTGKVIYQKAVNRMNLKQQLTYRVLINRMGLGADMKDYTADSRQPIASSSKWLSAALVMTFVDEGLLHTSDTVGKYLPLLSGSGKGRITIAQCLSHTTGIKAPDLRESLAEMRTLQSMDDAIRAIAQLPMEGEPGAVFRYSNAGLQIAAAVIEKISGRDFKTLFAERIALPLDMRNTDFGETKVPLPAGGARSTPSDYMHFLHMILNKGVYGNKRILSARSITEMQENRINASVRIAYSPAEAGEAGYGYGEWVLQKGNAGNGSRTVSSPGLFGAFPWVDNEKNYCGFLMTFNLNPGGRNERYMQLKQLTDEMMSAR